MEMNITEQLNDISTRLEELEKEIKNFKETMFWRALESTTKQPSFCVRRNGPGNMGPGFEGIGPIRSVHNTFQEAKEEADRISNELNFYMVFPIEE